MKEMRYAEALAEALTESLQLDPSTIVIGRSFGGVTERAVYDRALEPFTDRVLEPPVSETGFCGVAVGAAMTGLRPVVALGTSNFAFAGFSQLVNEAAVIHYATRGRSSAPVVFYMYAGIRTAGSIQHSATPQSMFWNTPGLRVLVPSSPADAKGLMKTAMLESKGPTIFIDHVRLQRMSGMVPDGDHRIPFGRAGIKRTGKDVTIIATSIMVSRVLEAADILSRKYGISAEIVDPRTLVPLDKSSILKSVFKTGRVVIADESQRSCGVSAEFAAIISEEAFDSLNAPIKRVAIPDVHVSYSQAEEERVTPTVESVVDAVCSICR